MELKLICTVCFLHRILLLIVPYGIETPLLSISFGIPILLIVPYGIETVTLFRN